MVGLSIQLVHDLGKKIIMTRGQEYRNVSRFKVKHLDILEDILDGDRMMTTIVRQVWTLAIVFGVGQSDKDVTKKTNFRNGEAHLKTCT
jgi:hypothetical protein